jgi:peptidoglycan/LPS O-acetylase OafA/YrhL
MGNALEVLRVATTFIVVLYHAALSYVATPLRLTLWVAYDSFGSSVFDHFVYWVNGFAMPVFFLAAGISAPAACESRGPRVFVNHRASRLLRPLLFGCLTVLPFFYLLWGYGLMISGQCDIDNILSWRFSPQIQGYLYGLGHLWFLEYLFLVSILWCGGWTLRARLFRAENAADSETSIPVRLLGSPWRPLVFAVPTFLVFLLDSDTMLRVDNNIVPNIWRVVHYLIFFAVGAWVARLREPKARLIPFSRLYLVLAAVVFAVMSPLLIGHAAAPLHGWPRVVYCGLASLFPWLMVFGGLGVLLRVIHARGAVMRFLTEASLWTYIVHVPIVALIQLWLLSIPIPGPVKFAVVAVVSIAFSLLTYEWVVRRSLVGEIINGARKRSQKRGVFGPEFGWMASLGVITLIVGGLTWQYRAFLFNHNCHKEAGGQIYRSARLEPRDLDALLRPGKIRTVVVFNSSAGRHPWYVAQQQICQRHGVALHPFSLRADRLPSRRALLILMRLLHECPKPVLLEGYRGIDHSGFAVAVAQLLDGVPPAVALRQFDTKYGQVGGPATSILGRALLDYQDYLKARQTPHTPAAFLAWVAEVYPILSVPPSPDDPKSTARLAARGGLGTSVSR